LDGREDHTLTIFKQLKDNKLVIFSGNLDECQFKNELLDKEFKTKIFFSYPQGVEMDNTIDLPKYCAQIINEKYQGIVTVKE
jgi:hypothetical protein